MGGHIYDDKGIRGGSPFDPNGASAMQRGGTGAEQKDVTSDAMPKVHSSYGFRRALKSASHKSDRLAGQLPSKKNFSGPKFRKPNYFAQGAQRHGMHIGSGAPATVGAQMESGGADTP